MKSLHAIEPPIPPMMLLAARRLIFTYTDFQWRIVDGEMHYRLGPTEPWTYHLDVHYWGASVNADRVSEERAMRNFQR